MPYLFGCHSSDAQNGMAEHGRCCWMRGAVMGEIPQMITQEIFDKAVAYSADGRFEVGVMFEFIPHGKINSVPTNETPYCRYLPGNALALIQWNENTPEKVQEALDIVNDLADTIKAPGEPYGNYSLWLFVFYT